MEVDFVEFNLDPAAPWFVQVGPDLELPAMGAIVLLLNARFPLVTEATREFTADRPELGVIRSMLYMDVARTLVEIALAHDDLSAEWPDDSLGDVLATLVESRFSDPARRAAAAQGSGSCGVGCTSRQPVRPSYASRSDEAFPAPSKSSGDPIVHGAKRAAPR